MLAALHTQISVLFHKCTEVKEGLEKQEHRKLQYRQNECEHTTENRTLQIEAT